MNVTTGQVHSERFNHFDVHFGWYRWQTTLFFSTVVPSSRHVHFSPINPIYLPGAVVATFHRHGTLLGGRREIEIFTDHDLAERRYCELLSYYADTLIVPLSDSIFSMVPSRYPLACRRHAIISVNDIPEEERVLYKLRYGGQ